MWLKQSTAVTVKMGPFVDSTDGNTEETALTISQADIRLSKNGGALAQTNNAAGATHDANGIYGVPFDTTDTGTLGRLKAFVHKSGALPVWQDFMVVPANVWDSFFGADKLQVHADEITANLITAAAINADAFTAAKFAADVTTEFQAGLATAAALTTIDDFLDTEIASILTAVDTEIGAIITTLGAAGAGLTAITSKTDNLPSDPADQSLIIAATDALATLIGDVPTNAELATSQAAADDATLAAIAALSIPTVGAIADGVWDEVASGHVTTGTFGDALGDSLAILEKLDDTLENDGGFYRFTENALEQAPGFDPAASGTADSGTTTTMVDAARTEGDDNYWKGAIIVFTSGTLSGQGRVITGFSASSDTITFSPATTLAVDTHTYQIWPAGRVDIGSVNGIAVTGAGTAGDPWGSV